MRIITIAIRQVKFNKLSLFAFLQRNIVFFPWTLLTDLQSRDSHHCNSSFVILTLSFIYNVISMIERVLWKSITSNPTVSPHRQCIFSRFVIICYHTIVIFIINCACYNASLLRFMVSSWEIYITNFMHNGSRAFVIFSGMGMNAKKCFEQNFLYIIQKNDYSILCMIY